MKTDHEIQQDIFRELRWDSRVDQTEIGAEVDQGIVTLTGTEQAILGAVSHTAGVPQVTDKLAVNPWV